MNFPRIAAVALCVAPLWAQPRPKGPAPLADFDSRQTSTAQQQVATDTVTLRDLRSRPGANARLTRTAAGRIKSLSREAGPLTTPSTKAREQIVRDFLKAESALFSFLPQNADRLRLLATDDSGGLAILNFQQHQAGLPVYEATLKAALGRTGELIRVDGGSLTGDLSANTTATLTAPQAIEAAYRANSLTLPGAIGAPTTRDGRQFYPIANGPEIPVEQVLLPTSATAARLAYRMFIDAGPNADYETLIDARDGSLLLRRNLVRRAGQARVWKESPLQGARELVTFADGWLPAAGLVTTGNNADAYVDSNGDGVPDSTAIVGLQNGRALSAAQVFDFAAPETAGLNPRNFKPASVTSLFYFVNTAHDYYYSLGFTEAAGNYQADNFGRGGLGNDAVIVRAQAGDEANNASFSSRPDGLSGVMRVGIWSGPTALSDDRDSGYDGTVIFHEMGHGVTDRLIGGPANTGCLNGIQSGAMSEGWSDYFASSFYNDPVNAPYASQDIVKGTRRQPYNTYTFTYEDLGNQGFEVHNDGEIWAATLLDMRGAIGSAETSDKLVVAALKLTPCSPSMVDARDAIVQADQALNGGANLPKIWAAFARHGLGASARGADPAFRLDLPFTNFYVAAFDLPAGLGTGNRPPVMSADVPPTGTRGVPYTFQVKATDPENGALTYTLISGPAGMSVNSTGLLQWTPTFTTQRVKVEVKDPQGARAVLGFLLGVDSSVAVGSGISAGGALDSTGFATFDVPAGTQAIQIIIDSPIGDPDLFIADPAGTVLDSEFNLGGVETSMISLPRAGRWTVAVVGYGVYQGTLSVVIPTVTPIPIGAPQSAAGRLTSERVFKINVPPYATQLVIQTSGGTGDVDIFVGRGRIPACTSSIFSTYCVYDAFSSKGGNTETITIANPGPGDWYITLSGYRTYADVSLVANYTAPAGLLPSQGELNFYTNVGVAPAPQTFLMSADPSIESFTWTATVSSVGGWLQGRPGTGQKGTPAIISPVVTGLAPGTYRGTVNITAPGVPGSPRQVVVNLVVYAASVTLPSITSVVNGASFANGSIAPGTWITIRGAALATTTRLWGGADFNGAFLPTALDNVRVKVNGKDALVYYISPTQINVLSPDDDLTGPVPVTVTNGQGSITVTADLGGLSPAFFMFDPVGRKYLAAVHPDGVLAGPDNLFNGAVVTRPAAPGGRVLLYATGFGPTTPALPSNQIISGASPLPASAGLEMTIGGVPAVVEFAGLVSNGLYQFNVVIPNVPDGDQQVVAKVGGITTPTGTFLTIRR